LEEFKTYKQFLLTQDDSITPAEAAKKYEVYKEDYRKKQARAFFKARKEEEWCVQSNPLMLLCDH